MMTFPTEWNNKTCSKPPTSNILLDPDPEKKIMLDFHDISV